MLSQHPEKLVPVVITNLLRGLPVPVYGDGRQVRDWVFVDDNAAAQLLALTHGEDGEVYNVGSGGGVTNLELVNRIVDLLGADPDLVEHVADRPGHDVRYALSARKITQLGWAARTGLRNGTKNQLPGY